MKKMTRTFLLLLFASLVFSVSGCDSPMQSEEGYKQEAAFIEDVDAFAAKPDDFKGKKIQTVLIVTNVTGKDNDLTIYATRSIMSLGHNPVFMLHYKLKDGESQLKRGDLIRFFGEYKQLVDSTEAAPGKSTRVLECDVKYITRPTWKGIMYNAGKISRIDENGRKTDLRVIFGDYRLTAEGLEFPSGKIDYPYRPSRMDNYNVSYEAFQPIPCSGKVADDGAGTFTYGDANTFTISIDSEQKGTWTITSDIQFQAQQKERLVRYNIQDPYPPVTYTVVAGTYDMTF